MKILSIDDDMVDLMSVKRALENDFEVDSSSSGEDAVSKIKTNSYDCIVLDYILPDIDGMDLLKEIRKITSSPVIVLTGKGDEKIAVKLMKAGAEDYLTKKETKNHLKSTVEKAIKKHWTNQESEKTIIAKLEQLNKIPLTDI